MKHIKKKFLLEHKMTQDAYEYLTNGEAEKDAKIASKNIENQNISEFIPHMLTTDKSFLQSFEYEYNGRKVYIPEPNPIVIYFSNAQSYLTAIRESKIKLFDLLKNSDYNANEVQNEFYKFYSFASNFVTSLFNSLEAFMNSEIPMDFKYVKIVKQKEKQYDKSLVLKYISFGEKAKEIMPLIFKKNFTQHYSHKYAQIVLLKKLRDNIVHTKADIKSNVNYYQQLFKEALDFDYLSSIENSRDYINFYKENLIELCDCGNDY